jgi:uncharacterized protein (DUF362 family)/Pyruvate/2-oxoacid:ferredoxin oxidoreductase delta subunit
MNNKISVRRCEEYDLYEVYNVISEIYKETGGPDVRGKTVLLKPNILSDNDPSKCVSTHPVVVEAMIRLMQSMGAKVLVGDSPAIHTHRFRAEKSGIAKVCESTGVAWVDFIADPADMIINNRKVRVASVTQRVDLIISLPKLKNHELMYFTGAIKNTLGLMPGFSKAKQHGAFRDRNAFGEFLVDLCEAITPAYFLMDGIMGMEGPGPGPKGMPVATGVLLGSSNPLALDIIAGRIAGYDPHDIPTTRIGLSRKKWLRSEEEIIYDGPLLSDIQKTDFKRIPLSRNGNSGLRFVLARTGFLRKLERRPVFIHENCTGCRKCINICPSDAIHTLPSAKTRIILTDSKCIRCFCCAEACTDNAVDIRVKIFGV